MKIRMMMMAAITGLAACSSTPAQSIEIPASGAARPQSIVVEPDSVICALVTVPQELWPDPLEKYDGTGLSTWLVNSFRKRFSEVGKLGKTTRFRTHDNDRDPACNSSSSIYVSIHFEREGDKKLSYRAEVHSGDVKRYLNGKVDVDEEIRSGRLIITRGESGLKKVIFEQVRSTANQISNDILVIK